MATATIDNITDIKYVRRQKEWDTYTYSVVKSNGDVVSISEPQWNGIFIGNNFKIHLYQTWAQWSVKQQGTGWHNTKFTEKVRYIINANGSPKANAKTWVLAKDTELGGSGAPLEGLSGKLNNTQARSLRNALDAGSDGSEQYRFPRKQVETWSIVDHAQVTTIKGKWLTSKQYSGFILAAPETQGEEGKLLSDPTATVKQTGGRPSDPNDWTNPYDVWTLNTPWSVGENEDAKFTMTTPSSVPVGTKIRFEWGKNFKPDMGQNNWDRNFEIEKTGDVSIGVLPIRRDRTTEGQEKVGIYPTALLANGDPNPAHGNIAAFKIRINDTSDASDTDPVVDNTVWRIDAPASVNEDEELVITMHAPSDVNTGTLGYEIKGIGAKDLQFGSMTGLFEVGVTESFTFKIKRDGVTEGDETLKFKITDAGTVKGKAFLSKNNITIVDTSDDSDVIPNYDVIVEDGAYVLNGVERANPSVWNKKQVNAASTAITRTFDVSDASMANHPLAFSVAPDGRLPQQTQVTEYTKNVTRQGTPGQPGATVSIQLDENTPQLYYCCSSHAGMGGYLLDVDLVAGTLVVKIGSNLISGVSLKQGEPQFIKINPRNGNWATEYDMSVFSGEAGGKKLLAIPYYDWLVDGVSLNNPVPTQSGMEWDPQVGDNVIKGRLTIQNSEFGGVKTINKTVNKQYTLQTVQQPDTGGGGDYLNPVVTVAGGKFLINGQSDFDYTAFTTAIDASLASQPPGSFVDVTFDVSDSSNSNHPLRFSVFENGRMNSSSEMEPPTSYSTGVTTNGTAGTAGATVTLSIYNAASAPGFEGDQTPELFYYCANHMNMGGKLYNVDIVVGDITTHYDEYSNLYAGSSDGEWNSAPLIENHGLESGDIYVAVRTKDSNWEADDPGAMGKGGKRVWATPHYDYVLTVDTSDSQNDTIVEQYGKYHANRHPGAIADDDWDSDQSGTYPGPHGDGQYLLNTNVIGSAGAMASPTSMTIPAGAPTYSHLTTSVSIKKNSFAVTEAYKDETSSTKTVALTYSTSNPTSYEIHSVRIQVESDGQSSIPEGDVAEGDTTELGDWKPQQIIWSYPWDSGGAMQNCMIKISKDGTQIYSNQVYAMAGDGVDQFFGQYSMDTDTMLNSATNNWHSGTFDVVIEGYTSGSLTDTFSFSFYKLEAQYSWDLATANKHEDDDPLGVRVAKLDGNGHLKLKLRIPSGTIDAFVTYTEPDESMYDDWETGDRTYGSSQLRWHTSEASGGASQSEYSWNGDLRVISSGSWMGSGKTWVLFGYAWDINSSDYSGLYQQFSGFGDGELPANATQFNDYISKTIAGGFKLELRT